MIYAHKVTPTSHGRYLSGAKVEGSLITLSGSLSQDNDSQTLNYTPKYEWDFSYNGTFSPDTTVTSSSVNHRYGTAGSYTVAIRYTDNDNQQGNIYTFTITIEPLVKRYYYVKDHLGNIRQTLDEGGNIVSAQDYYPFGGIYRAVNTADANDKYKFTEKERDKETDYDYFGARYYDSDLSRWLSVDPLADKYAGWSPYNYAMNNPLRFIDPDGEEIKISGNLQMAQRDILELAGKNNAKYVQFGANGTINLTKDFQVINGGGSELLQQIVNSKDLYEYSVSNTATVFSSSGILVPEINLDLPGDNGIESAVKDGMQNPDKLTNQPLTGDVQLTISPHLQLEKMGKLVPRTNILYHELKEAQLMRNNKLPRYTFTNGATSAHGVAGLAGNNRVQVDKLDPTGADGKADRRVSGN